MSDCRNPDARWPTAEIMRRARLVDDTGLIPFVDTEAAARYLALSPHSLECLPIARRRPAPSTSSGSSSATPYPTCRPGSPSAATVAPAGKTRGCTNLPPPSLIAAFAGPFYGERSGLIPDLVRRSGIRPDLKEIVLRFVPTPIASQLTGLSTDKLREWTSRRALVPADVRPKGKGSPAQFSWQTVLVLRIAVLLREDFRLELQAHKASFGRLRKTLRSTSFIALWGRRLALAPGGLWTIAEQDDTQPGHSTVLIDLDPHLSVLRDGFALPDASGMTGQFDLFSLPSLHGRDGARSGATTSPNRRRTA